MRQTTRALFFAIFAVAAIALVIHTAARYGAGAVPASRPYWPETLPEFSIAVADSNEPFPRQTSWRHSVVQHITWRDVTDCPARFVADPFLFRHGNRWYLFMEVLNAETQRGEIAVATSPDGVHWQYEGLVLAEPFHLSFPAVFEWQGRFYMVPESARAGHVYLYEAQAFPRKWVRSATLLDLGLKDPILLRHNDRWWMFASGPWNQTLYLYSSDQLQSGWQPHPNSPVVRNNGDSARCGGRIATTDGQLFRVAQDCNPTYGNQLRVFNITELTTETFSETEVPESPVLKAGDFPWAPAGMHQLSAELQAQAPAKWLVTFDGYEPAQPDLFVNVDFQGDRRLRGLSLRPTALTAGSACMLRLFWLKSPLGTSKERLAVFVHFQHKGRTIFQADHELVADTRMYEHVVRIPADAPAGRYDIVCGLYVPGDGRRIPLETGGKTLARLPLKLHIAAGTH